MGVWQIFFLSNTLVGKNQSWITDCRITCKVKPYQDLPYFDLVCLVFHQCHISGHVLSKYMHGFLLALTKLWSWIWRNFEVWAWGSISVLCACVVQKNLLLLGFVAWCGFCRCVWLLFFEVTLEIDTMLLQVILPGNLRGILGGTF